VSFLYVEFEGNRFLIDMLTTSSSLFLAGCFSAVCPCIVYSRNRQHLRSLQYQGTPLLAEGEKIDEHCCIYCGLVITGYQWLLHVRPEDVECMIFRLIPGCVQVRPREEIRERYGIRGGPFQDCLISWFCRSCALTQEHREIELEERNFQ
jgi:Cys-rich protein (TIGR01571 family)